MIWVVNDEIKNIFTRLIYNLQVGANHNVIAAQEIHWRAIIVMKSNIVPSF
jgi:hypothetical protein